MLKSVIDKTEEAPAELRRHYVQKEDGRFWLDTDDPRLEFRDNNIALTKEVERLRPIAAAFEGVDPKAAKDAIAKVAELGTASATQTADLERQIADLTARLDASDAARKQDKDRADKATLRTAVGEAFTKMGGKPKALDFIVGKAEGAFEVVDGNVVGKKFSPSRPGEKLTVDEFIAAQIKESDFAFAPSSGGGAAPKSSGAAPAGPNELRNPTPHELGRHANDIASGKIRVTYSD